MLWFVVYGWQVEAAVAYAKHVASLTPTTEQLEQKADALREAAVAAGQVVEARGYMLHLSSVCPTPYPCLRLMAGPRCPPLPPLPPRCPPLPPAAPQHGTAPPRHGTQGRPPAPSLPPRLSYPLAPLA
jgi:hypothetical protein